MEGWINRCFQYFSLEKDQNEFEKAQQWDGYKNYIVNQDGYVVYTFDRKTSIRLDDLLWFINIGFIRITGWQCVKLLKDLVEKYQEMEKQKITHGNLSSQTIWLVFEIQEIKKVVNFKESVFIDILKGCQLNYGYRSYFYKVHFTGYSLNQREQKEDEKAMIIIIHSILGIMHLLQTEKDKNNKKPFIESVQESLYYALNNGIQSFMQTIQGYIQYELHKNFQHFQCMDIKFSDLDMKIRDFRLQIIKEMTEQQKYFNDDLFYNLNIDNQVRNIVLSRLSEKGLLKAKEKGKSQLDISKEQWEQTRYMLCPPEIQNQIKGDLIEYENEMNAELGLIFKFVTEVPIQDLNQWIQEQFKRFWLLSLIESQCLNSCSQFYNFIQTRGDIDYKSMKLKILKEYSIIHEKAFEKIIEDLINTLQ